MSPIKLLIDVRSPEEFASGHRDGAINIPIENIAQDDLGILASTPKDTEIGLYCLSGSRAEFAKHILNKKGYTKVTNLGGLY